MKNFNFKMPSVPRTKGAAFSLLLAPVVFGAMIANAQVSPQEEDGAYLDPAYPARPKVQTSSSSSRRADTNNRLPTKSDTESIVAIMTEARTQGARGTCSIFSATAMAESFLIAKRGASTNIDLSEQWLQYLIMRNRTSEGSSSDANFRMIEFSGMASESTLPYVGETWETINHSFVARSRCGHLRDRLLSSCLLGHYDPSLLELPFADLTNKASKFFYPEIAQARTEAQTSLRDFSNQLTRRVVFNETAIKQALAAGTPLTLDVDFYYGAWNHRKAPEFGMERNMDHWDQGLIGYPAAGSVDRRRSKEEPAGHSVVIVGYDDELEVEIPTLMDNGQMKNIKYKGVYYFKNSWGQSSFGRNFKYNGRILPGYGMITQKYAHDYGAFYSLFNR